MQYFDEVVSARMVKNGKPAPDIYLFAAEKLGLKPEECMALEDSQNGIRSANTAGCKTVMVPDLAPATEEILVLCETCLPDLLAVRDWLEQRLPGE